LTTSEKLLRLLLPPGEAFGRVTPSSYMGLILTGLGVTLERVRSKIREIVAESRASTAVDLDPWAELAGLPDPDFPLPSTDDELRAMILARMNGIQSPTALGLEAVALSAGFVIKVIEWEATTPTDIIDGGDASTVSWTDTLTGGSASAVGTDIIDGGSIVMAIGYFYVRTFAALTDDEEDRLISIIERYRPLHLGTLYDFRDTVFRAGSRAGEHLLEL